MAARVMRLALDDAGLSPSQVDYINTHATSTRAGDLAELAAIRAVIDHQTESALMQALFLGHRLRDIDEMAQQRLIPGLHRADPRLPAAEWVQIVPADDVALRPFAEFLQAGEPLCGRLQPEKLDLLFGARATDIQSAALLPLNGRGMLAIGSNDANRFYPGMGTLFLRLMSEALQAALARYDE